jgi:hypothetical protein
MVDRLGDNYGTIRQGDHLAHSRQICSLIVYAVHNQGGQVRRGNLTERKLTPCHTDRHDCQTEGG